MGPALSRFRFISLRYRYFPLGFLGTGASVASAYLYPYPCLGESKKTGMALHLSLSLSIFPERSLSCAVACKSGNDARRNLGPIALPIGYAGPSS